MWRLCNIGTGYCIFTAYGNCQLQHFVWFTQSWIIRNRTQLLSSCFDNCLYIKPKTSRYSATLTSQTYAYLLRFLESSQSHLILNILNQVSKITIAASLFYFSNIYLVQVPYKKYSYIPRHSLLCRRWMWLSGILWELAADRIFGLL